MTNTTRNIEDPPEGFTCGNRKTATRAKYGVKKSKKIGLKNKLMNVCCMANTVICSILSITF